MPSDNKRPIEKSVRLFEERGETSRFVDAEVNEHGDLVFSGQDVGKGPLEWWGDSDYEFWVIVASHNKGLVLKGLVDCFGQAQLPQLTNDPFDEDLVLLAQLERVYRDHFHAVDEFIEFLESRDIPFESGNYA